MKGECSCGFKVGGKTQEEVNQRIQKHQKASNCQKPVVIKEPKSLLEMLVDTDTPKAWGGKDAIKLRYKGVDK